MTALQGLHPVRVVMGTVYPSPFLPRCPSGERCEPLIPPTARRLENQSHLSEAFR